MPRPRQARSGDVWRHVIRRGAPGAAVFRDPAAARLVLGRLAGFEDRFGTEIHAFCVMGSHCHLLVRGTEPNLAAAILQVGGGCASSTRLVPVRAERHAVHVTRYIHLNPVAAGLVARAEDWPWSSYRGYLNPPEGPPWLHTRTVLARFGAIGVHARYRAFVEDGLDKGARDFFGGRRIEPTTRHALGRGAPDVPLATIARRIGLSFGCEPEALLVRPVRARAEEIVARGAFVFAARRVGRWTLSDIAAWLGYAKYTSAARAVERFAAAASSDPALARRLETAVRDLLT